VNEQMAQPTLLRERSKNVQLVLVGLVPLLFGAVAGIVLGASAAAYRILLALAALGGFLAGFEHDDVKEALGRGAIAGAIFGLGILVAHGLAGTDAEVSLGSFPPLLIVIDAIAGAALAALGSWTLRGRHPEP
jgi:hypothetical protein